MQSGHGVCACTCSVSHARQSVLNICPGCDDGAEDHQSERKESHGRDSTTEPKNLSVCDQDDGKVLEDSIDGNREKLEGPGARVDHTDEEKRDGKPYCC
jgi:hypothetical protein